MASLLACKKSLPDGDNFSIREIKNELWLYNTMSRQKELFKPKLEGKVGMYVCGVTAYDFSHIGHARVYVAFDVLYRSRYLKYLGYEVNYVRNFTDVDDKIIARANEMSEDPFNLSRRYCKEFHHDMAYLNCLPPSMEPRVSDHMPQIIDMIKQYGLISVAIFHIVIAVLVKTAPNGLPIESNLNF
ncbi:hypothetical protein OROGR_027231 [Orobanche gracilis]